MALKIDNEIVKTAMTETLMQNVDNFSAGTNGGIVLSSHYIMGDIEEYSQLAEIATLVARRDITADTDAAVKTLDSVDANSVVVYFSTGSIEFKKVDARRYGSNVAGFSAAIGVQIGIGFTNFMLNNLISAAIGAFLSNAGSVSGDGTGAVSFTALNNGLKLFGDASNSVVAWIMTGESYHNLIGDSITNYMIDSVAGGSIATGTTQSLGRPIYVTDAVALDRADVLGDSITAILGITVNALKMAETATREVFSETVGGKENLKVRIQAESDVLLSVKGFSYSGTANPTETVLETDSNWDLASTDIKSSAGILIKAVGGPAA